MMTSAGLCARTLPISQSGRLVWRSERPFGEAVIDFANNIPRNPVTSRLIAQLVGCGTSVGANYCEADDAVSKKEFRLRCGRCKKEARETKFFLRMIVRAVPEHLRASARETFDARLMTKAELFTKLAAAVSGEKAPPFDFAIADEAQDLTVLHLRFFAALGGNRPKAEATQSRYSTDPLPP